jgi:hypothetical protein
MDRSLLTLVQYPVGTNFWCLFIAIQCHYNCSVYNMYEFVNRHNSLFKLFSLTLHTPCEDEILKKFLMKMLMFLSVFTATFDEQFCSFSPTA